MPSGGIEEDSSMCQALTELMHDELMASKNAGRTENAKETAARMYSKGFAVSMIAELINQSQETVCGWLGLEIGQA